MRLTFCALPYAILQMDLINWKFIRFFSTLKNFQRLLFIQNFLTAESFHTFDINVNFPISR